MARTKATARFAVGPGKAYNLWREYYRTVYDVVRDRLTTKTGTALLLLVLVGVPNLLGYAQFWWGVLKWIYAHSVVAWGMLQTTTGKWLFLICLVLVIWWDQRRIARTMHAPARHNLRTIKGRTLQLRDDMQRLKEKAGPRPKAERKPDENEEDFFSRTIEETGTWQGIFRHTYELDFAPRLHRIFHECALSGTRNDALWFLLEKPYQTPDSFSEIIDNLTWMAKHVD